MTSIYIGDSVYRKAKGYEAIIGTVIDIQADRARVKWPANRTWNNLNALVKVPTPPKPTPKDNPQL